MAGIREFRFSAHALDRALDMGVSGEELRCCLQEPWWVRDSGREDGRSLYYGERITCVVADCGEVVTVVWRTAEAWKSDVAAGAYQGRRFNEEEWA